MKKEVTMSTQVRKR